MIDKLFVWFKNGTTYVKKHPQLLMTMLLIVVIPLAFLFSGQQFLQAGKQNQERLEQERIGILHDLFLSVLQTSNFNYEVVQRELDEVKRLNPDITEFRVLKEVGVSLEVVASHDLEEIGSSPENPGLYTFANVSQTDSFITPFAESGVRYWRSVRASSFEGYEKHYIYTKTSLEHIDSLFSGKIIAAYYWLFGILLVIIYLVIRHVRLIDYAYLYSETKKANQMKDLFTNMIAHELRTPLTSIRGYASLIRERDDVHDDVRLFAERIEDSSGRLVNIVNDLLDVARIQSGRLSIQNEELNLNKLIESVVETQVILAKEKGISLSAGKIQGEIRINGDEKRLYQAFTNLVSNSIKYTKAGSITVSAEERSDRVEIRVKDTGMGMSAESQKQLFAPFFRIENTETKNIVGTGLGMWITKQLIELMKGSIDVESIKGVGTHIVVTLPK